MYSYTRMTGTVYYSIVYTVHGKNTSRERLASVSYLITYVFMYEKRLVGW